MSRLARVASARRVGVLLGLSLAIAALLNPAAAGRALAATTIGNVDSWNGTDYGLAFGSPCNWGYTENFGQTITAPTTEGDSLTSFTFYMEQPTDIIFRGEVYQWDAVAGHAVGSALWESAPMTTTDASVFQPITFTTSGVQLTPGQTYILFATTLRDTQTDTTHYGMWGKPFQGDTYAGGHATFDDTCDFADLTASAWDGESDPYFTAVDFAFSATFDSGGAPSDTTPPVITITTPPDGATYTLNQVVNADYSCVDPESTVTQCAGPVADGNPIDTSSVGIDTFTVNAANSASLTSSLTPSYTVAYGICPLYDQTSAKNAGSTIPIKLELCDANGVNVSSPSITVAVVGSVPSPGNANPGGIFRYDPALGAGGGYIFNLKATGFSSGTHTLSFTAGDDPTTHSVQFAVR